MPGNLLLPNCLIFRIYALVLGMFTLPSDADPNKFTLFDFLLFNDERDIDRDLDKKLYPVKI